MRIQEKLYLVRKVLGWSQEAMGFQLGISQRHYGRLENRETRLSINTLEAICETWGLTLDEFMKMNVEELQTHVLLQTRKKKMK